MQLTPSLVESQIQRIADTAETLIKAMRDVEPAKQLKNNKKVSKEVEVITIFHYIVVHCSPFKVGISDFSFNSNTFLSQIID